MRQRFHRESGTRILVLDDDAPSNSLAPLSIPDLPTSATDDSEMAAAAARALVEAYAESPPLSPPPAHATRLEPGARVLTPVVTQQLRALIGRISELLGLLVAPPSGPVPVEVLRRGDLMVDVRARIVARGDRRVSLSPHEFDLLFALIRRRGLVASRTELLQEVWGPSSAVRPRVVDTLIARLRRKLEDVPSEPRYILTDVAQGYRFAPARTGDSL
jgi:transcriptional regulator